MKKSAFVLLTLLNFGLLSSSWAENVAQKAEFNAPLPAQKPIISVSIPPQEYFVRKIAGNTLQINVIIPAGTDEHNFDFKPATMQKVEKSDIYFGIGLEIEKNLTKRFESIAKNLHFIDTGEGLRNLADTDGGHLHSEHLHGTHSRNEGKNSHGEHEAAISAHGKNSRENSPQKHAQDKNTHAHSDENKDPHIWLDPILVKAQADIIANALIAAYPHNKALYEANLANFQAELDALHAQISALLANKKGKKFIVYHPSWAYFAARYDLVQIAVEFEGKEPKARDLQRLIEVAKKEQIATIFIQKGFPQNMAKSLAKECGANVVEINHLSGDWHNELVKSATNLGH